MDAPVREQKILSLLDQAGFNRDPFLREFRIQLNSKMTELSGRVLSPPQILYNQGNVRVDPVVTPRDGSWQCDTEVLFSAAECRSYSMIAMVQQHQQPTLQNFCQALFRKATDMGLRFPKWPDVVKYGRTQEDIPLLFKDILHQYRQSPSPCDLIVVVLGGKNSEQYSETIPVFISDPAYISMGEGYTPNMDLLEMSNYGILETGVIFDG